MPDTIQSAKLSPTVHRSRGSFADALRGRREKQKQEREEESARKQFWGSHRGLYLLDGCMARCRHVLGEHDCSPLPAHTRLRPRAESSCLRNL
jgi:hypothetical protein